ncbi:trypco2 family protein [Kribbella solani]|uniref:Trypsin-co-occurring domain-containing protein n=1 Tax=Kribbella solani TaxID=236067 RepID=A0A841E018_9ACTN|nr:trypco2 family protein [Kribbella solani]MBB5983779.1 hypothetical protein [Kribbella solani]MDX2973443.1 hypothetical protein [Kribbella solani]MDX3003015.1 hypothetical protein [Kribbella solani]
MKIELATVVSQLRAELSAALADGADEDLRFELGPIELELNVVVGKEAGPTAKVRFWVVDAGADARFSTESTQRIKLTLEPRLAKSPGERPWIAGDPAPGER